MNKQISNWLLPIILVIFLLVIVTPVVAADPAFFSGEAAERGTSDDGFYSIKSTENNTIYLFETGNNAPAWSYSITGTIGSVAISGNGKFVAIGSDDGRIWLLDQKGNVVWNKTFGTAGFKSIVFSKDGYYLDASDFLNRAYYITIEGNPATRSVAPTSSWVPSASRSVTTAQNPSELNLSGIGSFLLTNLNVILGIILGLTLAGIVGYGISRGGYRQRGIQALGRDLFTLRGLTTFSLLLMLIGLLSPYYLPDAYQSIIRSVFRTGIVCFTTAYFLYAVHCWSSDHQVPAVFMLTLPLLVNVYATSRIPAWTSNIIFNLFIQLCAFALISEVVLFICDKVKRGIEYYILKKRRPSRLLFIPNTFYIITGILLLSVLLVTGG